MVLNVSQRERTVDDVLVLTLRSGLAQPESLCLWLVFPNPAPVSLLDVLLRTLDCHEVPVQRERTQGSSEVDLLPGLPPSCFLMKDIEFLPAQFLLSLIAGFPNYPKGLVELLAEFFRKVIGFCPRLAVGESCYA